MKFSNMILSTTAIIIAFTLSGCEEESKHPANLVKFLPSEKNATKYIYKTTISHEFESSGIKKSRNEYSKKIITSKNDSCVFTDEYPFFDEKDTPTMSQNIKRYIVNGKIKGISEKICAGKDKIYYKDLPVIYQQKKNWTMELHPVNIKLTKQIITAECHFISLSEEKIFKKTREVIHTQCIYKDEKDSTFTDDWFIAEKLGVYKRIIKISDNHNILKTTTILDRFE
jgi:hypothetical protein